MDFRVGIGQDSHKIKSKIQNPKSKITRPFILGGVPVGKNIEIIANSDGDVVLHAICLALSSAMGGRSLSFYDSELIGKRITDSKHYIQFFLKKVEKKGYNVGNISIMVEAGRPKLEHHTEQMKKNISQLLKIDPENIGICFTTGEGLTAFGKGEGIQAIAMVSLFRKKS